MNAQDMARRLLKDGDLVYVSSKRGTIVVPLQASPEIAVSQAFIAMHWGEEYLSGLSSAGEPLAGVNAITTSAYCPTSKQPELKHAAVKIVKADLPWSLLAMAWLSDTEALNARKQLKALMKAFPFTSCTPFSNNTPLVSNPAEASRERTGILFRASGHEPPGDEVLADIERILKLNSNDALHYADRKKGQRRTVRLQRVDDHAELLGFALSGDTSAEAWIKTLLQDELPAEAYGRLLLLPGAKPPAAVTDSMKKRGKLVCTCLNVTDAAIDEHLASLSQGINLGASGAGSLATDEARLASLQSTLKCGTNCGSCVPELKRMVRSSRVAAAAVTNTPPRAVIPIKQVA
jgi:assimilatory nitrate reductase catalytic subunit